ncbi:MAG: lytic transglycosylase domain-containing protein [Thermomicrobiales bacterium]
MEGSGLDLSRVSQQLIASRQLQLGGWLQGSQTKSTSSTQSFSDSLTSALTGSAPIVLPGISSGTGSLAANVPFRDMIESVASSKGVPSALIAALIQAESNFNPNAVSSAGAKGLMQLMDGTAANLGVTDPFDPLQNITGGTTFLTSMLERYDGNVALALAAYNAGPGAVDEYQGIPPYAETQAYVPKVLQLFDQYQYRS